MDDANDNTIQEQKIKDKEQRIKEKKQEIITENELIMAQNMEKLEKCIKKNMDIDQRLPYNRDFKCYHFNFLYKVEYNDENPITMVEDTKQTAENYVACMYSIGVLHNSLQNNFSKLLPNTYRILPDLDRYIIEINMTKK